MNPQAPLLEPLRQVLALGVLVIGFAYACAIFINRTTQLNAWMKRKITAFWHKHWKVLVAFGLGVFFTLAVTQPAYQQ